MVLTGQHGWSVCQTVTLDGDVVEISGAWVLALSPMVPISAGANIRMALRLAGEVGESVMAPHCRSRRFAPVPGRLASHVDDRDARNRCVVVVLAHNWKPKSDSGGGDP